MKNFISELSNHLENNMTSNPKMIDTDSKWNNLMQKDLILYDKKIITKYRDEMLIKRNNILQNYAKNTKKVGEMYYIYDTSTNEKNSYNLCICEHGRSNEVVTKGIEELPEGACLGSVLRKQDEKFILDIESTKAVGKEINMMIKNTIEEQNRYLNSRRIDGHIYECGEKNLGRIWLYDLNNVTNGRTEGIEEIEFPKDIYETAKEGDLFVYENGEYKRHIQ